MLRRLAAPALLALAACSRQDEFSGPPVLVIGVDGLEWSVLEPLMAAGRAPNLKALAARGVAGTLETVKPAYSPVVWTSIATGAPSEEHGILFFNTFDADGKPSLPYTSECRKLPAIWNVAGAAGRSVLSVAWWVSWPAERVPNARIVASYAAQAQGNILWKAGVWSDGLPELTWPESLLEEILPALREGVPTGALKEDYDRIFGLVPPQWEWDLQLDTRFRTVYHGDRTHLRIAVEQLHKRPADLNMVYLGLPDVAGHYFWRYHEPEAFSFHVQPDRVQALSGRIAAAYEQVDAWVGELVAAAPAGARILVISDHGMHANAGLTDENKWNNPQSGVHDDGPPGVAILAGPGIPARGLLPAESRRVGSVYDVFPTLLDWLDLPQPPESESPGQPLRAWMSPEWQAQQPLRRGRSYRDGFRKPAPPRQPLENADEIFQRGMQELGYVLSQ
ncbi:MAG: hypothetical protein EYC70_05755 [Planctomycetota bacterium]|nr:MAG: hypothetical protein EYC70_05755 [Planctomycetota bacterium]